MKKIFKITSIVVIIIIGMNDMIYSSNFIPANNPNIQYFGRWDLSDSLHAKHSWPGVYICAEFTGTSISIRIIDKTNYYNVYIDGEFYKVFHGDKDGEADYTLAENLENTNHSFRLSKRNIVFGEIDVFSGFILDDEAELLPPPAEPKLKIEFAGDSFTAAESNETTEQQLEWTERYPVTNIDKGFAPLIAKHYNAQYHTTCRSGIGMVCDWQGNFDVSLPKFFDRTLMEAEQPKWDFKKWIPDLVVVCLGLNDMSGLKDSTGNIPEENSLIYRSTYHEFISSLRKVYPGVKILAVAAFPDWIRNNVKRVVDEEQQNGHKDIYYAAFDYFESGYVGNGHPTVETHKKMADQIIAEIDSLNILQMNK